MRTMSRLSVLGLCSSILMVLFINPCRAVPPFPVSLPEAIKQADFVGIVKVVEVPQARKGGFRASAPPVVVVKPVSALKGDEKENLAIVWQTYCPSCVRGNSETIEVVPPAVGDEYMVYLTKCKDGSFARLGYDRHFHKMPTTSSVASDPDPMNAWRVIVEVSPAIAGVGETVRYRCTSTRIAETWIGEMPNLIAGDFLIFDYTRKQVLKSKKPGVRKSLQSDIKKGDTCISMIDLTDAFGITKPGEYWLFREHAREAPLRFEVTDRFRILTDRP